jgi:hypothetical protein
MLFQQGKLFFGKHDFAFKLRARQHATLTSHCMNPEKHDHRSKQKEAASKRQCFPHYKHEPVPANFLSRNHPHG